MLIISEVAVNVSEYPFVLNKNVPALVTAFCTTLQDILYSHPEHSIVTIPFQTVHAVSVGFDALIRQQNLTFLPRRTIRCPRIVIVSGDHNGCLYETTVINVGEASEPEKGTIPINFVDGEDVSLSLLVQQVQLHGPKQEELFFYISVVNGIQMLVSAVTAIGDVLYDNSGADLLMEKKHPEYRQLMKEKTAFVGAWGSVGIIT